LFHLIRLCLTLFILNVDTRITLSQRLEYQMTATVMSRLAKVKLADFLQVAKANIGWLAPHLIKNFLGSTHF